MSNQSNTISGGIVTDQIVTLPRSVECNERGFGGIRCGNDEKTGELKWIAVSLGFQFFEGRKTYADLFVNSGNAEAALAYFSAAIEAGKVAKVTGKITVTKSGDYTNYKFQPTEKTQIVDRPEAWGELDDAYVAF